MQIKKKKSLATSLPAYDEIFLYVNGLVIKMYKEKKPGTDSISDCLKSILP